MDRRTIYSRCIELLKDQKGKKLTLDEIKSLIMMNLGGCERTIAQALQVMAFTKLIKDIGNYRFKIL